MLINIASSLKVLVTLDFKHAGLIGIFLRHILGLRDQVTDQVRLQCACVLQSWLVFIITS